MSVSAIPQGMHSLTPHLTVHNAAHALDWYGQVFGAKVIDSSAMPNGKIMHATIQIGDSRMMLNDEFPEMGGPPAPAAHSNPAFAIHLYVADADQIFHTAVAHGARVTMPICDMFWGDRYGQVIDPFGYRWAIATRKENLTREQLNERARGMFGGQ